ncbi:hypothetical protein E2C01_100499 [Portunus trituberculatus]|uniref:Secreted protein n=1 Tax=Portunus trituberculatus TaxID=210409 RepID=A0A5B7K731_PORTR|nr:hypothetical protein [Portunus trituberculatus]
MHFELFLFCFHYVFISRCFSWRDVTSSQPSPLAARRQLLHFPHKHRPVLTFTEIYDFFFSKQHPALSASQPASQPDTRLSFSTFL